MLKCAYEFCGCFSKALQQCTTTATIRTTTTTTTSRAITSNATTTSTTTTNLNMQIFAHWLYVAAERRGGGREAWRGEWVQSQASGGCLVDDTTLATLCRTPTHTQTHTHTHKQRPKTTAGLFIICGLILLWHFCGLIFRPRQENWIIFTYHFHIYITISIWARSRSRSRSKAV